MLIGIDPGHGGSDPGAVGPSGLHEAEINLDVGIKLAEILKRHGLAVVSTRTEDKYVSLFERVRILNRAKCDYAISIHCNSAPDPEARYISTFIQAKGGEAEKLAEKVQRHLVDVTGWTDGGVRVSNLHMTRETPMPAILVEMGFISNPAQEARLKDEEDRNDLATAIAKGVLWHLGINYIPEVAEDTPLPLATIKAGGKIFAGVNISGRVYAPVRALAEALGHEVGWDDATKTVTIKGGGDADG